MTLQKYFQKIHKKTAQSRLIVLLLLCNYYYSKRGWHSKMYVHTKFKAKPKKIYLTAMALLLMFGTVASPTSVVGLQVAQAKAAKVKAKSAKTKKSKEQTPRDGLQAIRDFNKDYASKKKPVFKEDKSNSSIANLGKDVDGYFTPNSKYKRNKVRYFGGGSGHWYKYMSGNTVASIRFVKDKKNLTSGSGSTGVVYPNISIYHNVHNRKMNTKPVTVRLTWMAGPKKWTDADMDVVPQKQLSFHTKSVSVSAQGNHSTDVFRVEYFLDAACKKPLKVKTSGKDSGDPVSGGSGAKAPKAAFTFKDIDYKQYIDMRKAKTSRTITPAFYDNGNKKKNQKTKVLPFNGSEYAKKGNLWTGGALGDKNRKEADDDEVDSGSIDTNDPRGWLTFIANDQHTYDYGHGVASASGTNQAGSSAKSTALKDPAKLKNLPKKGYSTTFGNLWAFGGSKGERQNQNLRWKGTATKYVSDSGISGATASTKDKLGNPGKHKTPWVKNLTVEGTDKPIYYGIVTNAAWPANYHKGDNIYGITDFGFVDNEISPGLDINYVKAYSQTAKGKPYYDKTYMFNITKDNDTHKIKAVLKDKYAGKNGKYSAFFDHRWTIVIKVTPNKDLPLNQPIHMKDGSTKLGASISNVAMWYTPTTKTTDTFRHGGGTGGSYVQIITTKPQYHAEPKVGTAHKYVFRHSTNSSDKNAWADDLEDNYDGGTVYPGQELKYQIRVHVPSDNSDYRYDSVSLKDNPNDNVQITGQTTQSKDVTSNGQIVTFDVTAKVKDDAKANTVLENSADVTFHYRYAHEEADPDTIDKDGHRIPSTTTHINWLPDTKTVTTNTTSNKVVVPNIKAPIKTAFAVEDGKLYPLGQFEYNKKFKYVVSQEVGYRNVDMAGSSFELSDDLPDSLKADNLTAKVYRLTKSSTDPADAGAKKTGSAKAVAVDDDTTYGVDVTNSEGSLKQEGNKFTWVGDTSKMPFKGETYTLVITGIYKSGGDKIGNSDENGGNDFAISNTAHSKIDGQPNDSNTLVVPVELAQPSLNKTIVAIHDDTTNKDITDFTQVLKPQDNYTITYRFTSFAGNEFDGKKYHLTDDLPDNMKITSIGKPKGSIMTEGGDGEFEDDDSVVSNITTSGTGTDHLTINNSHVKAYGQYSIDVKASVKGQGDWSNYYDRMVYNNGTEGSKDQKATDSSYMKIPNEANETYEDSDSVDAHNSSGIDFNMGVQTLKVKQYIAQDDSKWTDDLKESHYLPVADGKADNSDKAVTTMLVIYAPNYLKDQKVAITTQADNSKVDGSTFDSGGFERGAAALSLMNNDDAIAYKNDASKLKFDNLNLKPAIDKANQTTSKTVDTQDLKTPGQTYTYEQKYSPTTKFAKKFAKLKNMHGTFSSTLKFSDSTENNDDYFKGDGNKGINTVGIKLSNIYGYTTRMSKGVYSQDGKKVDIKTYGEQIGLAVDNDHKTNFADGTDKFNVPNSDADQTNVTKFDTAASDKSYTSATKAERIGSYDETAEKQPVAIWVVPKGGNNIPQANGKYAGSEYGQLQTIKLKSNVGQGETAKIGEDPDKDNTELKDLNAADFWPSSNALKQDFSLIGFSSGSARTMTKGHSVVIATTDPQSKNKEDTIAANRVTQLKYEPYVQHVFTAESSIDRDKHKDVSDVKTDFVKPNTVATNPAQFITYYDSNALPEKQITDTKAAAQRVLREAYWLTAPKTISAKASYGLEMPYQLHSFTFGKTPDDKTLNSLYQTNLQSKDAIFDAGNTKTANDERLGFSYDATQEVDKIKQTLNDNTLGNKTSLETLLDAIDPKSNKVVADDDAWLNILPDYNLIDISYRFNNRVLDHGKQAFAKDNVMYDDYNKNMLGYSYGSELVQGGFRNYLRDDLDLTNYPLNLYSSTANRGLINIPGFGVGYATSFDFTQDLDIYGTRMATKNDHDAQDSDILVQPALSGQNAQKQKDLDGKGNDWLKHNDAGSLAKDSSSSKILTR